MKRALLAGALTLGACGIDVDHDIDADITHHIDYARCSETCEDIARELMEVLDDVEVIDEDGESYVVASHVKISCKD